jgi:hypothetical protein
LARKGLSVIAAYLLSQFPNFRWDLERRVTPVEIATDRNQSIVVVESHSPAPLRARNAQLELTQFDKKRTSDRPCAMFAIGTFPTWPGRSAMSGVGGTTEVRFRGRHVAF